MNRIKIFISSGQSIAGKTTKERVNRCLEYGLRKPDFIQDSDFMTILWRSETNENQITGNATGNAGNK